MNMYLQFLSFLHTDMTYSWNPSPCKTRTYLVNITNLMAANDLMTEGAWSEANMVLTYLNRDNSVPAC